MASPENMTNQTAIFTHDKELTGCIEAVEISYGKWVKSLSNDIAFSYQYRSDFAQYLTLLENVVQKKKK